MTGCYVNTFLSPLSLERETECLKKVAQNDKEATSNESSADIRKRVMHCHELQKERFKGESFSYNSKISTDKLEKYCFLGSREKSYMENMFDKLGLTARTYHKILKVARTIADLDGCESIKTKHLNEAICYRSINEKFWGGAVS